MESNRRPRTVINPKIRQVGFFSPPRGPNTDLRQSPPTISNPISPVMIPPPIHNVGPLSPLTSLSVPFNSPPVSSSFTHEPIFSETTASQPLAASTSLPASSGSNFPDLGPNASQQVNGPIEPSKPLKEKLTKAERRAIQEAQRAAKAEGKKLPLPQTATASESAKPSKTLKKPDASEVVEKKSGERPLDKDRKKDIPHPRMQYDDEARVEKAKKRAVVKPKETKNRVELFRHLPQYERDTLLPDLESKFFELDPMHPAVYKVGLQYLTGEITGGNARCIAMLRAFQEAIKDYVTPSQKTLARDLTAKIGSYVSFLIECRPLSVSMGNAIRFVKNRIAKLPVTLSELEAKSAILSDITKFIDEKIVLAGKVIVKHAVTKIRDGDVLLAYGCSRVVEMIFLHARELGRKFRVVVVDSRPKTEGARLLRRLVEKGVSCTYTHINAVSYVMHEVTRVFLGASAVLSNGTVYSRVGTAAVAMVGHAFRVPVLVCCEAYKFHERVQLDSICSNELGNPEAISHVDGREDVSFINGKASENLQLLNLTYDLMPVEYVSMIITDFGMVPPTSVPVIVREYRRDQLLF